MNSKYEIDMCNGPIMSKLITFVIPLALSGMLQLLFNAVDTIVVGRFSGSIALAAVGSTTALIGMYTNLFIGVSLGANVMTARYIASGEDDMVAETVHTSILMALISGLAVALIGLLSARLTLRWMGTPDDVIDQAVLYLQIYFLGMPFFMLYNFGAAILRAVGDTRRPLIFLVISGILNAILNMVLVIVFHLGVVGVAVATVFSQFVSCLLVLWVLLRSRGSYQLIPARLTINSFCLKHIIRVGVPAGIQSVVISFSNVLLQSSVNSFGAISMAGYSASHNLHGFIYMAVNSVSQGCMSFTSQNMGARKPDRMDAVLRDSLILQTLMALIMGVLLYVFGNEILQIYTTDPDVVAAGMEILSITMVPYFLCGIMDLFPGAMRGMGRSTVPMIISVIGTVGVRILWIAVFFPLCRTLFFLFICYPLSWTTTIIAQVICYIFVRKKVYAALGA